MNKEFDFSAERLEAEAIEYENARALADNPQTGSFASAPDRLVGELEERIAHAKRALQYHHPFLDDYLRAILPHDLILLGAPSGQGKTDIALSVALNNAKNGRRCAYFALEAEPRELERRVKFSWLSTEAHRRNMSRAGDLNYTDWYLGKCEDIIGDLNAEADQQFSSKIGGLLTFYRGLRFDKGDLRKMIETVQANVDLIVIDHLHYIDADDGENENKSIGDTTKAIRDIALIAGKPVLLIAHLRKKDQRLKALVPSIDDFHGSSNITKIATQVITIERASSIDTSKMQWWQSPTFMTILKDRRSGISPFVALTDFDKRTRRYGKEYTLGRLTKGGTEWEQIKYGDRPGWATSHRPLDEPPPQQVKS